MRLEDIKKYEGEVCILDLVNGAQVTTKITELQPGPEGSGKNYAVCGKMLIFQVSVEPHNPALPPGKGNPLEHKVRNATYGFPLFESKDDTPIDLDHIIMAHDCHADMEKVYLHQVSGIQIAGAGALDQLEAAVKAQREGR